MSRRRRSIAGPLFLIFMAILLFTGAIVVLGSPINPIGWHPDSAPASTGVWAPNGRLRAIERMPFESTGGEDVAILDDGTILTGAADGWMHRATDGGPLLPWIDLGGRPLGMDITPNGDVIVAVAGRGLRRVTPDGDITDELTAIQNRPLFFADDVDVADDGTLYFTVATWQFPYENWKHDILESRGNGGLYALEPGGEPTPLAINLHFANGVAVAPDESYALVAETSRYRVRRVWLSGPNAPGSDVWIDNLPGFPDGIAASADGTYWLAIASPRNAIVDRFASVPMVRHVLVALPEAIQPQPTPHAQVVQLDAEGTVLQQFDDTSEGCFSTITSVQPHGADLWFGSLTGTAIGRLVSAFPVPTSDAMDEGSGAPDGSGAPATVGAE